MNDLFLHDSLDTSPVVFSDRILYTPTSFAKTALLYLQEIGSLQAKKPHTSSRTHLSSYLFFCVNSGSGELEYQRKKYKLGRGDCVFIDCQQPYSHSTDKDLWSLSWIHFSGVTMQDIYRKYQERGGCPVFHPENITAFTELHKSLFTLASSDDYIRDMRINGGLNELLVLLMKESWHPAERSDAILKKQNLDPIRDYLDTHYTEKVSLDALADQFFISKFYLTRVFKEQFGVSINTYVLNLRITKAKQMLRAHPEYLGERHKGENTLPILIKFIDAKKDLSVQVYPTDAFAQEHENGQLGKDDLLPRSGWPAAGAA